jgi:hypothetical protein
LAPGAQAVAIDPLDRRIQQDLNPHLPAADRSLSVAFSSEASGHGAQSGKFNARVGRLVRGRPKEPEPSRPETRHSAPVFVPLERTSAHLFIFQRAFYDPAQKDYAVAAINGTLAPRSATHFVRTIGIDHKKVFAGEGFRVLTGGVVEFDSGLRL